MPPCTPCRAARLPLLRWLAIAPAALPLLQLLCSSSSAVVNGDNLYVENVVDRATLEQVRQEEQFGFARKSPIGTI